MKNSPVWGAPSKGDEKGEEKKPKNHKSSSGSFKVDGLHVYFYKGIDSDSIAELMPKLRELEILSKKAAIDLGIDAPPIHLHIHSYGGSVFSGFAAMDAILKCEVPIHTHIEGAVASAGTFLSVAGKKRTIGANSYILIHQLSSVFWGKYEEMKDEMLNYDLLMENITQIYKDRTKMTAKQLKDLLKRDLWLTAEQALEYGLVDEIR